MRCSLTDEDGRAVDLLLNRPPSRDMDGGFDAGADDRPLAFTPVPNGSLGSRLVHLERLLKVLELLPATDPPDDLVRRTLQLIAAAPARVTGGVSASQRHLNSGPPPCA